MNALIIEDSRLARLELSNLLSNFPTINVIGYAENGDQAVRMIQEMKPDLIFLDINLPGKNGFEVLEIVDHIPQVIFTTAYDEFAIKSFEYNAIDYLLKPIQEQRLQKAIEKLDTEKPKPKEEKLRLNNVVFVKDGEKCWFVTLKEIRLFESVGNYTKVFFQDQKPMIPKSLTYLESVLDPEVFFRINRQQIVNLKAVRGIDSWFNGKIRLTLENGEIVEVSRRQTQKIKDSFSF
jgi:two-component system LytT family response regulator